MNYCPAALLDSFALLMAGHGRCVCTSMMLGDRGYAMEKLASAHAFDDVELQGVTRQLVEYFEESATA